MNARTCQLCGKPLSRLRVGGDSDFCSREHRDQHRLRRGMVRLEEANKVTSLMRRRENPRHISAARLMCNSALERRGFLAQKTRALSASFTPVLRGPAAPRVASRADRYVPLRASPPPGTDAARPAETTGIRIHGRGTRPLVPPRPQKLLADISRAPLVSLRCEAPAPSAAPRDFRMLRPGVIRIHLGNATLGLAGMAARRAPALDLQAKLRHVKSPALEGQALRVSRGIGFRVRAVNRGQFVSRAPKEAALALVWPGTPLGVGPEWRDSVAVHRNLAIAIPEGRACMPEVADGAHRAQFEFPGTLAPCKWQPAGGRQPAKRTTGVLWKLMDPRSRGVVVAPPAAALGKRGGTHLFTIQLAPSITRAQQQLALSAFLPQEPVGCPRVDFEGMVAAALAGSPVVSGTGAESAEARPAAPDKPAAMVRIEEHFGSGWDDWMGGMKGWRVDVAGVRTGPLALFVPSLELIDYELEFLARIDARSLSWVVRAAGLDEYLLCTLTTVGGGELEFSHRAVAAGVAQAPVMAAQRVPGKPRAAMTVGTCVCGDTFTITLDGKTVDTWNDNRFPMGGVGFTGAADDPARLYWVRLSSTELSAKEHHKK